MSIDSFSQLPFMRPAVPASAAREKQHDSSITSGIRLFGIQVPREPADHNSQESSMDLPTNNGSDDGSRRRFECHYCCRHFPTSQALGGHQNAHKRERHHAMQAQLHSAMVAAFAHQPPPLHGHKVYGLPNCYHHHHQYCRFGFDPAPSTTPSCVPSWPATMSCAGARLLGRLGSATQPIINGSPLIIWRVPPAVVHDGTSSMGFVRRDSVTPLPPIPGAETSSRANGHVGWSSTGNNAVVASASSSSSTSSSSQIVCESMTCTVKETVSLDLHL